MLRKCKKCDKEKEITEFLKRGRNKNQNHKSPLYRYICKECGRVKIKKVNPGWFKKGQVSGTPFKKGLIPWSKGKFRSHGGISRCSRKYLWWKEDIHKRDDYKCVKCGAKDNIEAHHIIPFKCCLEKRFDIDNGITLCCPCHMSLEQKDRKRKPHSEETKKKMREARNKRK